MALNSELSCKQLSFVIEYLKDGNGTEAAIRAGYAKKSAHVQATRQLKNDKVLAEIERRQSRIAEKVEVSVERVLKELMTVGFSNVKELFTDQGILKDIQDIPESSARSIASIEVDELFESHDGKRTHVGQTKKIKFWDKPKALEMLGKHLKMFTDKVQQENTGNVTLLVSKDDLEL